MLELLTSRQLTPVTVVYYDWPTYISYKIAYLKQLSQENTAFILQGRYEQTSRAH